MQEYGKKFTYFFSLWKEVIFSRDLKSAQYWTIFISVIVFLYSGHMYNKKKAKAKSSVSLKKTKECPMLIEGGRLTLNEEHCSNLVKIVRLVLLLFTNVPKIAL